MPTSLRDLLLRRMLDLESTVLNLTEQNEALRTIVDRHSGELANLIELIEPEVQKTLKDEVSGAWDDDA